MLKFELSPAAIDDNINEMAECVAIVTIQSIPHNDIVSFYLQDDICDPKDSNICFLVQIKTGTYSSGYESWYIMNAAEECYEVLLNTDKYRLPSQAPLITVKSGVKAAVTIKMPQKTINIGKLLLVKEAIKNYCKSKNIGEVAAEKGLAGSNPTSPSY